MRSASTAFVGAVGHATLRRATAGLQHSPLRSSFLTTPSCFPANRRLSSARLQRTPRRIRVVAQTAPTQQQTAWNVVSVVENSPICEAHRYIVINVGTTGEKGTLCDSYRMPGMYVQIRQNEDAKPGFFAISCAPNIAGYFEFLIKESDGTQWLSELAPGDSVEMSPVMGKGFPMNKLDMLTYPAIPEEEKPYDILLFATGSGIAPIRAAIEARLNGLNVQSRRSVKLFYGARYPERMAYMDRFKLWEEDGIEVIPVMSRPTNSKLGWDGRTGYIQDALKEYGINAPNQTAALLCGVKGMTEDVKAYLKEAGVPEDRILFNF